MMKTAVAVLLLVFCGPFYGQGVAKPSPKPSPIINASDLVNLESVVAKGLFSADGYSNKTLSLRMLFPLGWQRTDEAALKVALEGGREVAKKNKSKVDAEAIDKSLSKTRLLFYVSEAAGRASLSAGVEIIEPGVTSRSHADWNVAMLRGMPNAKLTKGVHQRVLAGRTWEAFETNFSNNGASVNQLFMTRVEKNYALFFIVTIGEEEFADELQSSLNSITFEGK